MFAMRSTILQQKQVMKITWQIIYFCILCRNLIGIPLSKAKKPETFDQPAWSFVLLSFDAMVMLQSRVNASIQKELRTTFAIFQ